MQFYAQKLRRGALYPLHTPGEKCFKVLWPLKDLLLNLSLSHLWLWFLSVLCFSAERSLVSAWRLGLDVDPTQQCRLGHFRFLAL